jgi:hypothetical protein
MPDDAYILSLPVGLVTHYYTDALPLLARDRADWNEQLDAFVSSGDYLITLLTTLESILDEVPKRDAATRIALEKVVHDLEYIERKYTVTKRQRSN